jgi:hypothetical protein
MITVGSEAESAGELLLHGHQRQKLQLAVGVTRDAGNNSPLAVFGCFFR